MLKPKSIGQTKNLPRKNWAREELLVAFNLYCKTPFGKIHIHNPQIIALAKVLKRSPSAVSWKLANFARLDPALKKRNISGATHGSQGEIEIWNEFNSNWEELGFESEKILAQLTGVRLEDVVVADLPETLKEGKERDATVRIRVNQKFFRQSVFVAYNNKCCITGLAIPELLNASHITPWSIDVKNRVNPRNGLCLNVLHDRAFDRGLITITPEYKVRVSTKLKSTSSNETLAVFLLNYDGHSIQLPDRFIPDSALIKYHNEHIFKA